MLGNKEIMAKNIQRLMDERHLTRQDVCNALGFNYSTLSEWMQGKAYPRIDKIEKMAKYFGVQKRDLVEEYDFKPSMDEFFLAMFHNLNEDGKVEMEKYLRYLISQDKYRKDK